MSKKTSKLRYMFTVYGSEKRPAQEYYVIAKSFFEAVAKLEAKYPKVKVRSCYTDKVDSIITLE